MASPPSVSLNVVITKIKQKMHYKHQSKTTFKNGQITQKLKYLADSRGTNKKKPTPKKNT